MPPPLRATHFRHAFWYATSTHLTGDNQQLWADLAERGQDPAVGLDAIPGDFDRTTRPGKRRFSTAARRSSGTSASTFSAANRAGAKLS